MANTISAEVDLRLVNQLGIKPLSKHSLNCALTLPCKLPRFFKQNPWTKSGPGDFQFGILPRMPKWKSIQFCDTEFTLQVFQPLCIPFPSIFLPKVFLILQYLADHHHIFLLPDSIPYKTASDYFETLSFV